MFTKRIRTGFAAVLVAGAILAYTLSTPGGSLEPLGAPQPTMRTLDEIYNAVDSLSGGGLTPAEKGKIDELFIGPNPGPFLRLEIDGNQVEGESTILSLDREGTIECFGYDYHLTTPRDPSTGAPTGRRQHSPLTIIKRIDKSTPLLYKALARNETVTSAEFRFYRPSPVSPGTEEHYYTVLLERGAVSDIASLGRGLEKISFVFQDITWTYEPNGATHKDSWRDEI